jgi:hypothetical protein
MVGRVRALHRESKVERYGYLYDRARHIPPCELSNLSSCARMHRNACSINIMDRQAATTVYTGP